MPILWNATHEAHSHKQTLKHTQFEWFGESRVAEVMYDTIYVKAHTATLDFFYGYLYLDINARKEVCTNTSQMNNNVYL